MTKRRISPELYQQAKELRRTPTPAEARLWQHLRRRQLQGYRFRRQHPIGSYIVDFCCIEQRLVVEVDGPVHGYQQEYDQERTAGLETEGYRVLRLANEEIERSIEQALIKIGTACGDS